MWPADGQGGVVAIAHPQPVARRALAYLARRRLAPTQLVEARDPAEITALLGCVRPDHVIVEGTADWRRALRHCSDAARWVVATAPTADALREAAAFSPRGLLTLPLRGPLVDGSPEPAADVWEQAQGLLETAPHGIEAAWLRACLDARRAGSPDTLLLPVLAEHVALARGPLHAAHGGRVPLEALIVPAAWQAAQPAALREVAIALAPFPGEVTVAPGAFALVHTLCVLLAGTLPGGELALTGSAQEGWVRFERRPGEGAAPALEDFDFERLFAQAREAGSTLEADAGPWPAVTLRLQARRVPPPPATAVLLEPDPLMRAWFTATHPNAQALSWCPGEPLPAAALAAPVVLADRPFEHELRDALGTAELLLTPLRERFGETLEGAHTSQRARAGHAVAAAHAPSGEHAPEGHFPTEPPTGPPAPPPRSRGRSAGLVAAALVVPAIVGLGMASPHWNLAALATTPAPTPTAPQSAAVTPTRRPLAPPRLEVNVSLATRTLEIRDASGHVLRRCRVAIGRPGTPTPTGSFHVVSNVADPAYRHGTQRRSPFSKDPGNPLGRRWLGLDRPGYGIHGTNAPSSVGGATSDGCLRLGDSDLEALGHLAYVGMPVHISAAPFER